MNTLMKNTARMTQWTMSNSVAVSKLVALMRSTASIESAVSTESAIGASDMFGRWIVQDLMKTLLGRRTIQGRQ